MSRVGGAVLVLGIVLFGFDCREAHGQIVTENGGVISPETPILRESVSFLQTENVKEVRWNNQFIIAAPWLPQEFKLTVPVVHRDITLPANGPSGGIFGLGDVTLRFKQSLWQDDDVMASTRWAAIAEVTAPTGSDDAKDEGVRFSRRLQLGTGAFTCGGGTVFSLIRDRHRFSIEGIFRHTTRHDGVRLGQSIDVNIAYWFRIEPAQFSPDKEGEIEVRGVIELLTTYRFRSRIGNSGAGDEGFIAWIAPGVQVYPLTWLLIEANVQVPAYQDFKDDLGKRKLAATLALKYLF